MKIQFACSVAILYMAFRNTCFSSAVIYHSQRTTMDHRVRSLLSRKTRSTNASTGLINAKTETEDTFLYYEKYSAYFVFPLIMLCSGWLYVIFFHRMFEQFQEIAKKYELQVTEKQCHVQANIWMNNLSVAKTPRSSKETKLKELKLSWKLKYSD